MKYLYPYECEKLHLSSPQELQAAIDGNRREGRRSGYGYDLSPGPTLIPTSHPHPHFNGLMNGKFNGTSSGIFQKCVYALCEMKARFLFFWSKHLWQLSQLTMFHDNISSHCISLSLTWPILWSFPRIDSSDIHFISVQHISVISSGFNALFTYYDPLLDHSMQEFDITLFIYCLDRRSPITSLRQFWQMQAAQQQMCKCRCTFTKS